MAHQPILAEIEAFIAHHEMAESTFGREALGDWRLVQELRGSQKRRPRRLWPETEAKVREFMASYRERAA
ncbi:hypothetical protein [Novosphingobium mathurense]|uniref:hypothetical protein n=1 Tax=Novosphingobium mathurense TaxID=428990 RepID=UPI0009A89DAF|nr:hypothetical protein [Novosphingobium mathurense]